ncbi:hypothetical protein EYR36_000347 [Pleurotus pulmonarius]|nr:hypothetical protein EYR36_000347 [Pleurotus pulmonarius]
MDIGWMATDVLHKAKSIFALSAAISLRKYLAEVKALLDWFEPPRAVNEGPVGGSGSPITVKEGPTPTLQPDASRRQGLAPITLSFPSSPGVVVCNIYQTQNNSRINVNHTNTTQNNCGNTTTTKLTNVGNDHCVW